MSDNKNNDNHDNHDNHNHNNNDHYDDDVDSLDTYGSNVGREERIRDLFAEESRKTMRELAGRFLSAY